MGLRPGLLRRRGHEACSGEASATRWAVAAGFASLAIVAVIGSLAPIASAGASGAGPARAAELAGAPGRSPIPARPIVVHVVQTTADLSQRMQRLRDVWMEPGAASAPMVINVQDRSRFQTILGFGATLTDSSAWLLHKELAPPVRNRAMQSLFGSSGLRLNYVRVPMGASDFTVGGKPYTYDDMPAGGSDPGLRHFSVAHDQRYIIPALRQARTIDPRLFIIANPWSAPVWMKTNHSSGDRHNRGYLLPLDYPAYAAYFVKFLQAYRRHGVQVDAVTPQNEPGVAADPGMEFPEPSEAEFIGRYLHPSLMTAGLNTQIYGLDMGWDMFTYADALAGPPVAHGLSGISWHCYRGTPTVMTQLHTLAPGLKQLINECSPEVRPFSTAEVVIGALRNWANAVALWNLALEPDGGPVEPPNGRCPGCRGLVVINTRAQTTLEGLTYYQLGQASRYIARGAVRIATKSFVTYGLGAWYFYAPTAGLDDVAFVNPSGEKVLVAYNGSPLPIRFAVSWHGHALLYTQPAYAMTTFTWN